MKNFPRLGLVLLASLGTAVVSACSDGAPTVREALSESSQAVVVGDIVITELFYNPADTDTGKEWFEVTNVTGAAIDINGWTLTNKNNTHTIANGAPLLVPAGGHLVLGQSTNTATNGGVAVAYAYGTAWGDLVNGNSGDTVRLTAPGITLPIDEVVYQGNGTGTWPNPGSTGVALNLNPALTSAVANNLPGSWCLATVTFGTDNGKGTPGKANTSCGGGTGGASGSGGAAGAAGAAGT
ncbi:MAG: lamin tail domain-containing protein, partial [Myxococcaceae bacterium]